MKTLAQILKWMAIVIVTLAVLVALFVVEENWRGARALAQYRAELEKEGYRFTVDAIKPQPVPDDQNFAMTPLLRPLFDYKLDPKTGFFRLRDPSVMDKIGLSEKDKINLMYLTNFESFMQEENWLGHPTQPGHQLKFEGWDKGEPMVADPQVCARVIERLQKYEPQLSEITAASRRPFAVYPLHYEDAAHLGMAYLIPLQSLVAAYFYRASAEVGLHRMDAALSDVQAILRIAEKLRNPSLVITGVLKDSFIAKALGPVWNGLQMHAWNAAQLLALQEALGRINAVAEGREELRNDMELTNLELESYAARPPDLRRASFGLRQADDAMSRFLFTLSLRGWVDENIVFYLRWQHDRALTEIDPGQDRVFPLQAHRDEEAARALPTTPDNYLVKSSLTYGSTFNRRSAAGWQFAKFAQLACALERFWQAYHTYPLVLTELVPSFIDRLPPDVCNGEPVRYRLEADDGYRFWSVGWDLKDDHGLTGSIERGVLDAEKGDWVWLMPGSPAPAAK
jgi:hypothetical protein